MRTVEFKVIETDPSEFCIVARCIPGHTGMPVYNQLKHIIPTLISSAEADPVKREN
jgi:hypothetical protein